MTHTDQLVAAAKAEDLYNLQQHIAWTDVLQPKLQSAVKQWTDMLISEALGGALPPGKTREQVAGLAYGVTYITTLMKQILKEGERALEALHSEGISINT